MSYWVRAIESFKAAPFRNTPRRELSFKRGDFIFLLQCYEDGWGEGRLDDEVGVFPLTYVEKISSNEVSRLIRHQLKYWRKESDQLDATLENLRMKMVEIKQKQKQLGDMRGRLKKQLKQVKVAKTTDNTNNGSQQKRIPGPRRADSSPNLEVNIIRKNSLRELNMNSSVIFSKSSKKMDFVTKGHNTSQRTLKKKKSSKGSHGSKEGRTHSKSTRKSAGKGKVKIITKNRIPIPLESGELPETSSEIGSVASIAIDSNPCSVLLNLKEIGEGTYGLVYSGIDLRNLDKVAVKRLDLQSIHEDKIINEIKMMQKLTHENVVEYIETYRWDDFLWVVMEYMSAGCLTDILVLYPELTLNEKEISYVVKQILQGIEFLHSKHILHRDLKSDNILLDLDGNVKLADFGHTVQLTKKRDKRKTSVGTPYWESPEVITGSSYGEGADIWSVGIIGLEMAVGEPPYMDLPPLTALRMIILDGVPGLPKDKWNRQFRNYLNVSLKIQPEARASASELMRHPFILSSGSTNRFKKKVLEAQKLKKQLENFDRITSDSSVVTDNVS